jgi:hypothetical protein
VRLEGVLCEATGSREAAVEGRLRAVVVSQRWWSS